MMLQASKWGKWEAIRAKGAVRFVVLYGVVGWGVLTAILFSAVMVFFYSAPATIVPITFLLFPVGGVAWGAFMWWLNERAYAKRRNSTAS